APRPAPRAGDPVRRRRPGGGALGGDGVIPRGRCSSPLAPASGERGAYGVGTRTMAFFQAESLWVSRLADGVASLVLDLPDRPVNVLNRQVLADLEAALDGVEADSSFQLLLIRSGKPDSFLAGADLHELGAVRTGEEAVALSERGQRLFGRLAGLRL